MNHGWTRRDENVKTKSKKRSRNVKSVKGNAELCRLPQNLPKKRSWKLHTGANLLTLQQSGKQWGGRKRSQIHINNISTESFSLFTIMQQNSMPGACVHVLMKKPVSKLSLVETKLGV